MRRFVRSLGFALLVCLVLAGVTALAYFLLAPTGEDVGNGQIVSAFKIIGWAAGTAVALISFILILIFKLILRLTGLRRVTWAQVVALLLGVVPWLLFGVQLTMYEPRFTPFARAAISFVGRPMLWGSLAAMTLTIVCFLIALPMREKPAKE